MALTVDLGHPPGISLSVVLPVSTYEAGMPVWPRLTKTQMVTVVLCSMEGRWEGFFLSKSISFDMQSLKYYFTECMLSLGCAFNKHLLHPVEIQGWVSHWTCPQGAYNPGPFSHAVLCTRLSDTRGLTVSPHCAHQAVHLGVGLHLPWVGLVDLVEKSKGHPGEFEFPNDIIWFFSISHVVFGAYSGLHLAALTPRVTHTRCWGFGNGPGVAACFFLVHPPRRATLFLTKANWCPCPYPVRENNVYTWCI